MELDHVLDDVLGVLEHERYFGSAGDDDVESVSHTSTVYREGFYDYPFHSIQVPVIEIIARHTVSHTVTTGGFIYKCGYIE
jgi:hypothetical protein